MSPDTILPIVITAVVELVGIGLGLFYFLRRYSLERLEKTAEAHVDEANALLTGQQAAEQRFRTYDAMFNKLLSRDNEIARLNAVVSRLQVEVSQIESLKEQLEKERARSTRLELALAEEREKSAKLQHRVSELETYIQSQRSHQSQEVK